MVKPCTFFRLILSIALFVFPSLLRANGEPTGNPLNASMDTSDSIESKLGHCNPIVLSSINCATHTIELSAWISWTFSGIMEPYVATWSTGQLAHKITVVPPGTWSWDPTDTGCEPSHWQNEYNQPESFFQGTLDILGAPLCSNGSVELTVVPPYNVYSFSNYEWSPLSSWNGFPLYVLDQPGLYQLTVTDQLGCTFSDQYNVPLSPPLVPTISGPSSIGIVGDSAVIKVNEPWNTYLWSTGDTNNPITVYEPGLYEVTVTNQFGCTGNAFIGIQAYIPPPWTVIPTSRNHTIIIPDTLKFEAFGGSLQIGDQIGVFYDSAATGVLKCGGYAVWSGLALVFPAYGNDATAPSQNGFNTGELFKVKIWRAGSNQISDATAQYAPLGWLGGLITRTNDFVDDGISMITALTEGITQSIPLINGWNMISSYINPGHPDMLEVFDPIASSVDIIKDGDGKSCIPIIPINVIGNWNLLKGYQVRANQKDTLLVLGHKAVPEANPIPLHTGWQIIGYLRDNPKNTATVFSAIQGQISIVKDNFGKVYSPQFGINTIGNMLPGQGYKVKALSNTTLLYQPNFTGGPVEERSKNLVVPDLHHFVLYSRLNTGNNATIILTSSVAENMIQIGDEVGVFTPTGLLCGSAMYQGENLAITVWGDDQSTSSTIEGMQVGEAYHIKGWSTSSQKDYTTFAAFQSGINNYAPDAVEIITNLGSVSGLKELATVGVQTLQLYPNPASETLIIGIESKKSGKVALTVLSSTGTRVWDAAEIGYLVGNSTSNLRIPAHLPSGIYWFRFQFEDGIIYRQVVLQK